MQTQLPSSAEWAGFAQALSQLAPAIRESSETIDRERRLPAKLVRVLAEAGFFRMLTPRRYGGLEVDILTAVRVFEAVSVIDGSVGWCLMIGNGGGLAGNLTPQAASEIFAQDPLSIASGAIVPAGKAIPTPGGFLVSGRWSFASGCLHSTWLGNGCVVYEGEQPRLRAEGMPEIRIVFLPISDCEVIDTWSVSGLRGTGSHDVAVRNVFVPESRTFQFPPATPPTLAGPLYTFPVRSLIAASVAAVPLGIARAAIDALVELAQTKTPFGSRGALRDRVAVRVQVAEAEALVVSARSLLYAAMQEAWSAVCAGERVSLHQRAQIQIAAVNASLSAVRAVDLMYNAGGTSSIYMGNTLDRAFRDVHVAAQHFMLSPVRLETAGQVLLGLKLEAGAVI